MNDKITFDIRFGKEKSEKIRQKISKSAKRSWEDRFGTKKANELKESAKKRIEKFNNSRAWTKEKIKEVVLKFYNNTDKLYKNSFWKPNGCGLPSARVVEKLYGSLDNMANELNISFYKHSRKKYLKEHPEVLKKILKNNPIMQKGYKYEDVYDTETSKNKKEQLKINMLKKIKNDGKVWNKGMVGHQTAWNKGLTKYDHKSIMKYSIARREYMRNNPGNFISSQEIKLSNKLKEKGIEVIPQYYVENIKNSYLADLFIPKNNIIVEIDGTYWHDMGNRRELDNKRTKQMVEQDYIVLRFSDKDIDNDIDSVINKIEGCF